MLEITKDPRTRKDVMFVVGKIEGVYFNPLKNVKTYAGPNGDWTPTHTINVVIDGDKVGFGLTDKETINAKDADGNYHELKKGIEVSVEITEVSEYKGKPQYSSKASKVTVLDASGAVEQQATGGQQKASNSFKKDMSGVVAGNGFNAAKALLGTYEDGEDFVKTAISLVEIGQKIRKQLKDSRADLDEYSIGAQSGMALIAACEVAEDISEVEDIANAILNDTLPKITEYVKEMENKTESPVKKTVSKKTAVKKPTKKLDPEISEDTAEPEFEEDDDSIPF